MEVVIDKVGKRFSFEWIFRELSARYQAGNCYAITGPNGSGKSTYLKIISGFLTPTRGKVSYFLDQKEILRDDIWSHISYAAPYIDLIEEFTLDEALRFHFKFKDIRAPYRVDQLPELLELKPARHKMLRDFSSGMKQRVKLGLSILTDSPLLILDEPGSNLDQKAQAWWQELLVANRGERIILIASNDEADLIACDHRLDMRDSV